MNASVGLLERVLPGTVYIEARVPSAHPSARILGTQRMGTGAIVASDGLVLTVNYVLLGATRVKVTLMDRREYVGELVAQDLMSGLALVRIAGERLPALPLHSSADLRLGDEVFIVASAGEATARVSNGVVSFLGAFDANWEYVLERAIMTTAMNPGLGGGPLLDSRGRVRGVVSLNLNEIGKFALAIPAEYYTQHRDELLRHGRRLASRPRPWVGFFCYTFREHIVIAGLLPGAPGEQAGLRAGDVILAVDGKDVAGRRELYQRLWARRAGERVSLRIFRNNEVRTIEVPTGNAEEFFA